MAGVGFAPCRAMVAEDIRDLQPWTRHARRALGGRRVLGRVLPGPQRSKAVERAHDLADRIGGDLGVKRRGLELGMPKQDLDDANIDVLLEQVGREAVAQGVRRHALADLGQVSCGMAGARELPRRHRVDRVLAGE